ncbi:MAG: XRE family transcriptional regulator [Acidimicrobiales bacterium]
MPNERLRDALARADLDARSVAAELGVDPKTVERWVTRDRLPYPRHRRRLARLLGESEQALWPDAGRRTEPTRTELIRLYPRRSDVPRELWTRLLDAAADRIEILVYAGLFLVEQQPDLAGRLYAKADAGVTVRLLVAEPDGEQVIRRGMEEGVAGTVASRVRNVLAFFPRDAADDRIQLRLHDTTLYNSIFVFDDEMLVNTHVYGLPAAQAPVFHLRRIPGGLLFPTYTGCYDRVWETARPV